MSGGKGNTRPGAERILLAHGSGGKLTQELVRNLFLPELESAPLRPLSDAALLPPLAEGTRPVLTTDSFVVDPPVFAGGDVGYLSVCGTVNDLVVAGAKPRYLTWALILEEGADLELIAACAAGAARAAREGGVEIVAGDTKVVPRGKGDRIYATTAGLGEIPAGRVLGDEEIRPGDLLLASGSIGDHGATILAARHDLKSESLRSDCAPLTDLVASLFAAGLPLRSLHDPTRGGVLATCHEVAQRSGLDLVLEEDSVPVRPEVSAVCDLLGLDPLTVPCEGRALIWIAPDAAESALAILHAHPLGAGATTIGQVTERGESSTPVRLRNAFGAERPLDLLSGMDLPRIC